MITPHAIREAARSLAGTATLLEDRAEIVGTAHHDARAQLQDLPAAARSPDGERLARRAIDTVEHVRTAPGTLGAAAQVLRSGAQDGEAIAAELASALRRADSARHERRRALDSGLDGTGAERRLRHAEADAEASRVAWSQRCQALARELGSTSGELGRITGRLRLDRLRGQAGSALLRASESDAVRGAAVALGPVLRQRWHGTRLRNAQTSLALLRHDATASATRYRHSPVGWGLHEAAQRRMAADHATAARAAIPDAERRVGTVRAEAAANRPLTQAGTRVSAIARHPVVDGVSRRVLTPLGMASSANEARTHLSTGSYGSAALSVVAVAAGAATFVPPLAFAGAVTLGAITVWENREGIASGARKVADGTRQVVSKVGTGIGRWFGGSADDE